MKSVLRKTFFSLVINLIVIFCSFPVIINIFSNDGLSMLAYYTEVSNIFACIVAIIYVVFLVGQLCKTTSTFPLLVKRIKYIATSCVGVTFFVVLFILIPSQDSGGIVHQLFKGNLFFHHFLCPILLITSFLFFEDNKGLTIFDTLYVLFFTFLYGIILVFLNVFGVLKGPYFFLEVTKNPLLTSLLWIVFVLVLVYLIALGLYLLSKRLAKKN